MGILEDSQNLSQAGKKTCLLAFIIGLAGIAGLTSQLGKGQTLAETIQKKTTTAQMLPSKPEEVVSPFSPTAPQSEKERAAREDLVRLQLKKLHNQLPKSTGNLPKEIILIAVNTGVLHPHQAQYLWEEIQLLSPQ